LDGLIVSGRPGLMRKRSGLMALFSLVISFTAPDGIEVTDPTVSSFGE